MPHFILFIDFVRRFDFEGMDHPVVANCSPGFDYGAAHVAMIRTVTAAFHSAMPHSTVTLTMGGSNISDDVHKPYLAVYPIPGLALVSDGVFIMGYDMNHHHTICADANAPLDVLHGNLLSYIQLGAPPEKLILGIPCAYRQLCLFTISVTADPELAPGTQGMAM